MKHNRTNLITRMLCAAIALLAFGCGGPAEDQPPEMVSQIFGPDTAPPPVRDENGCTGVDEYEAPHVGKPGYNFDGCTKTERMAKVKPWGDEDDGWEPAEPESDVAQLEQPISVLTGPGAGGPVSVNAAGNQITGFIAGGCPTKLNWTTAEPIRGNCVIPNRVAGITWAICPTCYATADFQYLSEVMRRAWAVWTRPVTCETALGASFTTTPQLNASGETSAYSSARIPVFPVPASSPFSARMGVDKDFISAKTPIRLGVRYWGWDYATLEVNHNQIEVKKTKACLDTADPNRDVKVFNAYIWIFAHELGHAMGLPHATVGLMRRSIDVSCEELLSASAAPPPITPAMAATTKAERYIVASVRDSSGFAVLDSQVGLGTSCSQPASTLNLTSIPDDIGVVAF